VAIIFSEHSFGLSAIDGDVTLLHSLALSFLHSIPFIGGRLIEARISGTGRSQPHFAANSVLQKTYNLLPVPTNSKFFHFDILNRMRELIYRNSRPSFDYAPEKDYLRWASVELEKGSRRLDSVWPGLPKQKSSMRL